MATCHDTGFNLFFVHDGAAGAYVHLPDVSTEYAPGQNLEIKGVARQGQFAPFIAEPQVRVVGPGSMPAAIAAAGADLLSGRLDAQWVEIRGVVRAARVSQARLQLTVVSGMTRFKAWVRLSQTNQVPDFANREVNLRGVVAAQLNAAKQVEGSQLFLNSLADVRTLDSPSDSAAAAGPVPVRDLQGYRLRREGGRRLQVRGTVAARWSSGGFLLVDPTGSVEVQSVDGARVAPDEVVEVTGFLTPRPCTPRLEDATVQRVGFAERTRPTLVADGNLWKPALQHQKVRVEADLVTRTVVGADLLVLVLQRGERFFRAALSSSNAPSELLWLEPGQRLDLTGVCHFNMEAPGLGGLESVCPWCDGACQIQSGKKPGQLQATLWLGEAADLRVSSKALPRWLGPGLAVGTLVLLLATAALLSRRRRLEVERLLAEQMSLQSELREQDRKLRRSLEERERIGHDLHDDIIQSIYAVGLGLEDTRRHLRKDVDKAESRLTAGVESLNGIIQRVRTFIGGLEPKVLNGAEFKTALKSLALTAGESHAQFHIQVDSTVANGLTSDLATQLLMIAKEAISNSLRHAKVWLIHLESEAVGWAGEVQEMTGHCSGQRPSSLHGFAPWSDRK